MKNKQKIKKMLVNYLVHQHGGAMEQAREEVGYVIKKDNRCKYILMFIAAERKRLADMNKELDVLEDLIKSSTSSP